MKRSDLVALCLCSSIVLAPAAGAAAPEEIHAPGETTARLMSRKGEVKVTIETTMLSRQEPRALPLQMFDEFPQVVAVSRMRILVGNRTLGVPRSVFLDVVNPRTVSLAAGKGEFEMTLVAGDASESSRIVVYFDEEGVRRRRTYAGTGELLEEAHYQRVVYK